MKDFTRWTLQYRYNKPPRFSVVHAEDEVLLLCVPTPLTVCDTGIPEPDYTPEVATSESAMASADFRCQLPTANRANQFRF